MAYIIKNSDGTIISNLANEDVDSESTSLDLIGKNVNNYGQYFNNNLVKLLTNFAHDSSPLSPQVGQLWYDTTLKRLTVYDGSSFNPTYGATVSGTSAVTTSTGDLWYDANNSQLKIWDGYTYKLIGPAVSGLLGKFGIEPPFVTIREDDTNVPQNVGVLYSYGNVIGLLTPSSFAMSAADALTYLGNATTSTIVQGVTIANDLDVKGDVSIQGDIYYQGTQRGIIKSLSAYYDVTSYGDFYTISTSTNQAVITAGNVAIRNDLKNLFPIETISTLTQVAYAIGSETRVLCVNSGTTSVRRFTVAPHPAPSYTGELIWDPVNLYYNTWTTLLNNIVL